MLDLYFSTLKSYEFDYTADYKLPFSELHFIDLSFSDEEWTGLSY